MPRADVLTRPGVLPLPDVLPLPGVTALPAPGAAPPACSGPRVQPRPLVLTPAPGPGWALLGRHRRRDGHVVVHGSTHTWGAGRAGSRRLIAAVVGHLLGRRPSTVGLARDSRNRPFPVDAATGTRLDADISLAHTDDVLVLGISSGERRIGVDVERADREIGQGPRVLGRICHAAERADLDRLHPDRRPARLVWMWTRKEAVAKADGRGLAIGLASLDVVRPTPAWSVGSALITAGGAEYWTSTALLPAGPAGLHPHLPAPPVVRPRVAVPV